MRPRIWMFAFLLLAVPARADILNGTVTNVDENAGSVTLVRSDTGQSVTVNVSDASGLGLARAGGPITLDATQSEGGVWSASSVQTLATSGTPVAVSSPIIASNASEIMAGSLRGPSITPSISTQAMQATDSVPGSTGTVASMASSTAADGSPRGTTQSGSVPPDSAASL